ncbi:hypothetical protein [Kocuria sabuli]|uniref:hypothetical protein n=1 Tax=Kocuria sabuli TaxID=3071448 RepID=UPI0034D51BA4
MSTSPFPDPRPAPELRASCLEPPRPEEVHVLLLGLDGLAAALAVRLLRCGVLGLNVNDGSPVTAADLGTGAFHAADLGRPRDAALRRRLRALDSRCAPVSAPELFPGALLPGAVVVRSAEHPSRAEDGRCTDEPEPWAGLDPRHPLVSLHRAGTALLRWPTVPWAHRPCPDCVRATLGAGEPGGSGARAPGGPGTGEPGTGPGGPGAVLTAWAAPAHAEAVAAGLAVEVLAVALDSLGGGTAPVPAVGHGHAPGASGDPCARLFVPPWPGPVAQLELDRSLCLCGLAQA